MSLYVLERTNVLERTRVRLSQFVNTDVDKISDRDKDWHWITTA